MRRPNLLPLPEANATISDISPLPLASPCSVKLGRLISCIPLHESDAVHASRPGAEPHTPHSKPENPHTKTKTPQNPPQEHPQRPQRAQAAWWRS